MEAGEEDNPAQRANPEGATIGKASEEEAATRGTIGEDQDHPMEEAAPEGQD